MNITLLLTINTNIHNSGETMNVSWKGGSRTTVSVLYHTIHNLLRNPILLNSSNTEKYVIGSKIISSHVDVRRSVSIEDVVVALSPLYPATSGPWEAVCAFWDTSGYTHQWSTAGCETIQPLDNTSRYSGSFKTGLWIWTSPTTPF